MMIIADHLGPFKNHPPVAMSCKLSKRVWSRLSDFRGGHVRSGEEGPEHLLSRLLYIAESTSTAVRMNASWSLTFPAMSLLRDRYEQVVRFSWLARQTTSEQLAAFIDNYYAKSAKVFGGITPAQWAELEGMPNIPNVEMPLSKEEREYLNRWESLDLRSMAIKRDDLSPKTNSVVEGQTLADLYTPIYQQLSSVSHTDMFALNMLGFHKGRDSQLVMAPDPQWPAVLCIFNCMLDIMQAHDAVSGFTKSPRQQGFDDLLYEWVEIRNKSLDG